VAERDRAPSYSLPQIASRDPSPVDDTPVTAVDDPEQRPAPDPIPPAIVPAAVPVTAPVVGTPVSEDPHSRHHAARSGSPDQIPGYAGRHGRIRGGT
jgi:hypothetical protein